jgi:membrane-associated phospholipid phosphatase
LVAVWEWGIEIVRTLQEIGAPPVTGFLTAITFLGDEEFYMVGLPLLLWSIDFALGVRLALVLLPSVCVNLAVKELFGHPRPFDLDPSVKLRDAKGFGLPSGHAQSAVVLWGMLAAEMHRTWTWVVAVALMILVGISRVYLGVHFPTDVLAGWGLGAAVLVLALWQGPRIANLLARAGLAAQLAIALVVALLLAAVCPRGQSVDCLGVVLGAGLGLIVERRRLRYSARGRLWQRGVRFLLGLTVLLALYLGLRAVFPGEGQPFHLALKFVRYAVIGAWSTLGAPWAFVRLGLARPEHGD